ncbi:MAG: nitrite reductase (NAD(P)H) small subunit [Bacteroidetes bacterium]|nr:nitrite reductase (NAD(P)H) small subunit [Bacteroidota bacterium]
MANFVKVTERTVLREGKGHAFTVEGRELALFLISGTVHAIENICPHQHIPVLAEGELEGTIITCPMHGWQFDLATGKSVNASSRLTQYEVRCEGENVMVAMPEDNEASWW